MDRPAVGPELPLFPLGTVLFPGGLLPLKVFEARYVDMVTGCLRTQRPFGVVALRSGHEVRGVDDAQVAFESIGTLAELIDVDSERPGILTIACRGGRRFRVGASRQQRDGLWLADATELPDDPVVTPEPSLEGSVRGLSAAITALREQGATPFLEPHRLDDAGWVANRWCEILPLPLPAKQELLEIADPMQRLRQIDAFLRGKGLLG